MKKNYLYLATLAVAMTAGFASCKSAGDEEPGPVTGVELSETAVTVAEGGTLQLTATVKPANAANQNVSWTTSSTAVASVDTTGKVTAVSAGTAGSSTAIITATTEEGGFTAACTVTVVTYSWGEVTFASSVTWSPAGTTLTWSDVVLASGCTKTDYNGGEGGTATPFKADCRSNPGQKGHLFSWLAVNWYASTLCPEGWRVPTGDDFKALDKALNNDKTKYMNINSTYWGGAYGGLCYETGELNGQNSSAYYWSSSDTGPRSYYGTGLYWSSDPIVVPQPLQDVRKSYGLALRCVK